ncbi:hypothetical protein [Actinoplanes sp. NPDC026623]|uniref:hypothetical protein n=1 Tax=Actinoplanes sp. NPDC026623 TaxID=3155610 RepID=UPI0033F3B625
MRQDAAPSDERIRRWPHGLNTVVTLIPAAGPATVVVDALAPACPAAPAGQHESW